MDVRQKGFTAIEMIIIVVAVLTLGFGGWFVWHANHKDAKVASKNTATAKKQSSDSTAQSQSGAGGETTYLKIPEWGVKLALTADTSDAYYDDITASSLDSFSLRSHSLDAAPDCKTASQSVATIFRVAKDAPNEDGQPGKLYRETQDGQVIGNYFYFISGAQYSCTDDASLQITLQGVRNGFVTAGPSIQKL
jgi:type II secretory pathway pseudopilin PulG